MASSLGAKTHEKKLQFSYKKPRLIPGKGSDEEIQKDAILEIEMLMKRAKAGEIHLVFADPTHKVHNTVLAKCWQERGKDGTLVIASNTGRKRVNVLGFLNPITFQFSSLITESNCDQYAVRVAHEELRKDYPDGKEIVVIQDNAKYHYAYAKSEHIKSLNVTPYFLPPYCPNLNLIERLWKFMKKKIMHNTYYETYDEFYDAIIEFCGNIEKYSENLSSIMSHKFEILKAV